MNTEMPTPKGSPQPELVRKMFSSVAERYDRANDVLSLGIHHRWRKKLVAMSGVQVGAKVLDCATGTGDLAIEFKKAVGPTGEVVGTDFCKEMLHYAPSKAQKQDLQIRFETADVTNLPYRSHLFDACSISFGIRNVHDPLKGLQEMARVTKPGGVVLILEFGKMQWPLVSSLYNFYSRYILPQIGGLVTGEKEAYRYLQESSAAFPCGDDFLNLMKQTNSFSKLDYARLSGGIAYIYRGVRG